MVIELESKRLKFVRDFPDLACHATDQRRCRSLSRTCLVKPWPGCYRTILVSPRASTQVWITP